MISLNEARRFADAWMTAWNSHDIENIIRLYADNVVIVSPIAGKLLGNPEVAGIDAVKNYFMEGLRVYPDLRFAVLHVLPGEQSIVLHYLNQQGVEAAECMHFDNDGFVHDKKIIEYTTTDYYKLGLEGLVAVLKSLSTVVFWMS